MEIGIGGWLPRRDERGELRTDLSPWFSFRLSSDSAPWAYARGEPYRSIAALEAVGVLVALVAFQDFFTAGSDAVYTVRGLTDNKGNRATISRLQSTKFPLCAVLMEVAAQSEHLGIRLALDWVPHDWNAEADRLSNGDSQGFDPSRRVLVDWTTVQWRVLRWALDFGRQAGQHEHGGQAAEPEIRRPRKKPLLSFRAKEPW